jgi:hypothetical protein
MPADLKKENSFSLPLCAAQLFLERRHLVGFGVNPFGEADKNAMLRSIRLLVLEKTEMRILPLSRSMFLPGIGSIVAMGPKALYHGRAPPGSSGSVSYGFSSGIEC